MSANGSSGLPAALFATVGIIYLVAAIAAIVCTVRIIQRAGYSGWWVLLSFVPLVNFVALFIFAFKEWPIETELQQLRSMVGPQGYPGQGGYPGSGGYPGTQAGGYPGAQAGGYPVAPAGGYPSAPGGYPATPSNPSGYPANPSNPSGYPVTPSNPSGYPGTPGGGYPTS